MTASRRIARTRQRSAATETRLMRKTHRLVSVAVRKGELRAAEQHFLNAPTRYQAVFWAVRFVSLLTRR